MSKRELLAVAVRLFAIGVALLILRSVPGSIAAIEAESPWGHWVLGASYAVFALIAWALWQFPFAVAALLLPKEDAPLSVVPWSRQDAVETGSIIIGLFYLYYALSDSVYWLVFCISLANYEGGSVDITPEHWAGIVTTVFEVMAAFFLIFGARHMARFIHVVRYAGKQAF